ncbi:MAG: hypothetical protein ABIG39_05730 [Candidatus Micrarchaeota archaeon]
MVQKTRVGIRGVTGHFATGLLHKMRNRNCMVASVGIVRDDPTLWRVVKAIGTAPKKKKRSLRGFFPKLMVLECEGNGARKRVEEINNSQNIFKFVPACDFNPNKECDIIVDVTRGARKPVEVQYEGFVRNKPAVVVLDTGKSESFRGRLIVPPFVEAAEKNNVWRLGDCVVGAISCLLSGMKETLGGKIRKINTTIFCILDARVEDNFILPERAHSIYFKAPPADLVEKCLKKDMEKVFEGCKVEKPVLLQAHSLNDYALVLRVSISGMKLSKGDVLMMLQENPHVFIAPEGMTSTFDMDFGIRRLLGFIGDDLPPIVPFSNSVEVVSRMGGTDVVIRAAVRYADIGPVVCIDAIRNIMSSHT